MAMPAWFDEVPPLRLHDGLAQLLGAPADGVLEYRYADAVRLAGHSCPTVAGAWLAVVAGLRALHGDALPERGEIEVGLPDAVDAGVSGVIGQVATLLTGAAGAGGFHGLGGRHVRRGLLQYGDASVQGLRLRRRDTGKAVDVRVDASAIPADAGQRQLLGAVLAGHADTATAAAFGAMWQARVRRLLLEHANDPAVVQVRPVD